MKRVDKRIARMLPRVLLEEHGPEEERELQTLLRRAPEARTKYERMRSIVRLTRRFAPPAPPAGTGAAVMARIAAGPEPLSLRALSVRGLACVFIVFAVFYCSIGVFMSIALHSAMAADLPAWIWRQPRIALLSALLFALCGVLLFKKGRRVAGLLYALLLCYMLCLVGNALQAQWTAGAAPLSLGLAGFVGGGLAICLFLGALLRTLPQNNWHAGGTGAVEPR